MASQHGGRDTPVKAVVLTRRGKSSAQRPETGGARTEVPRCLLRRNRTKTSYLRRVAYRPGKISIVKNAISGETLDLGSGALAHGVPSDRFSLMHGATRGECNRYASSQSSSNTARYRQ